MRRGSDTYLSYAGAGGASATAADIPPHVVEPPVGPGGRGNGGASASGQSRVAQGDRVAGWVLGSAALIVLLVVCGIFVELVRHSWPSIRELGWGFLTSTAWNPVIGDFGALSSIYGTVVTSAIAMVIAVPMSILIALFLVELAPPWLASIVGGAIELLAAIPSIIYGMWGLFVLAPYLADYVEPALQEMTFGLPLFQGPPLGIGILPAGLILALMVLPFMTSITRDVFRMTPSVMRESAYGMGATMWEVTRKVTLPHGLRGVTGAGFLALSRALGETMAVTFVIGNSHKISSSLLMPGNTISSTLANEFSEASEPLYLSALIELGLVLFGITVVVQVIAGLWMNWADQPRKGA